MKIIVVSDPRKKSGTAGGAMTAILTCRVCNFCSLLEGRPCWIMFIWPRVTGYFCSSPCCIWCTDAAICVPVTGCAGTMYTGVGCAARMILLRFRLMYDVLLGHVSSSCYIYIWILSIDFGYISFLFLVSYMNCALLHGRRQNSG